MHVPHGTHELFVDGHLAHEPARFDLRDHQAEEAVDSAGRAAADYFFGPVGVEIRELGSAHGGSFSVGEPVAYDAIRPRSNPMRARPRKRCVARPPTLT